MRATLTPRQRVALAVAPGTVDMTDALTLKRIDRAAGAEWLTDNGFVSGDTVEWTRWAYRLAHMLALSAGREVRHAA